MDIPGYTHQVFGIARYVVECEDGVVRELPENSPLFRELQERAHRMIEQSMVSMLEKPE